MHCENQTNSLNKSPPQTKKDICILITPFVLNSNWVWCHPVPLWHYPRVLGAVQVCLWHSWGVRCLWHQLLLCPGAFRKAQAKVPQGQRNQKTPQWVWKGIWRKYMHAWNLFTYPLLYQNKLCLYQILAKNFKVTFTCFDVNT